MDARDCYEKGRDTKSILDFIKTENQNLKLVEESAHQDIVWENECWDNCIELYNLEALLATPIFNPEQQHLFEEGKIQHEKRGAESEKILDEIYLWTINKLKEYLTNAKIIGIGYIFPILDNKISPQLITPDFWPYLTIDQEADEATGGNLTFKSVRYYDNTKSTSSAREKFITATRERYKAEASNGIVLNIMFKEPKRKDDWFYCIIDHVKYFISQNHVQPIEAQTWNLLLNSPLTDMWAIETKPRAKLDLSGKSLDRETFKKRYKSYYPESE